MTAIAAAIAHRGVTIGRSGPFVSRLTVEEERAEEQRQIDEGEKEQLARPARAGVAPKPRDPVTEERSAEHHRRREIPAARHAEGYEEQRHRDQRDDVADDVRA